MKLEGSVTLAGPADQIWKMMQDPAFLAEILPGCKELLRNGEDQFTGILEAKVGPIGSSYTTKFLILDKKPPESYRMQLEGTGKGGFVRADTVIVLQNNGAETLMSYNGEATIGGTIAKIGQRVVESAAKMMISKGFKTLQEKVAARLQA